MRYSPDATARRRLATALLWALPVLLASCALAAPVASGELLANPGFESLNAQGGPENWSVRDWGRSNNYVASRLVGKARFGQRCLQLEATTFPVFYGAFTNPVDFGETPPSELLLTIFYRTTGTPQPDLSLTTFAETFADKEWNTPPLTSESVSLEHTVGWRAMSWRVHILPAARQAIVMVRVHGSGSIFLDGASLKPYAAEVGCEVLAPGLVMGPRGPRQCRLRLTNHTDAPLPVTVQLDATTVKGPRGTATASATLATGTPQTVDVPYSFPSDVPHSLAITVSGAQPEQIYDHQFYQVPGLLAGEIVSPAFRGALLSSIAGTEITVRGRVNASAEYAAKVKLGARLVGLGAEAPEFAADADGRWECKLPAATLLSGTYAVRVTARAENAIVGTLELPLVKPPNQTAEVGYDERMRLWQGGKPRLPIGLFYALEDDDFAAAAEAGFNTLVLPARLASTRAMEQVDKLGLSAIISSATMEQDFWGNMISKFGLSPQLTGWYPLQKPGSQVPPVHPLSLADLYARLRAADPRHPVCLALDSLSRLEPYAPWCDVIMPWTDPEPAGDLRSVDLMLQRAMIVAAGRKPVWPVIQITGAAWSQDLRLDPAGAGRPPTPDEYRCMVYLAFARGASGIFDYAYRVPQSHDQREYSVSRDAPELWQMVRRVGLELKALTPVLLEGEPLAIESPSPALAMRGYRYKDVAYVIAVNPTNETMPVSFTVPGLLENQLEVAFDQRKLVGPGGGQFGDQLEAHAVRVYMGR